MKLTPLLLTTLALGAAKLAAPAQLRPRARALGVPFEGETGRYNAITDVPGVLVGYRTLVRGRGTLRPGKGPVRTGVTVILPRGRTPASAPAAWFSLDGDGEMTGLPYIEDYGTLAGPVGITNTSSVGVVRDAIGAWNIKQFDTPEPFDFAFGLPVVAETFNGLLNDIDGLHVTRQDVWAALDGAQAGPVAEGNVGGGTGMVLCYFKGGSGTASRRVSIDTARYVVGAFVQANFGLREDLTVAGVPVGREITDLQPVVDKKTKDGSIIVVIGTNAPLLPSQLKQLAKRATIGVARTGGLGRHGSGDIFLAFSTQAPVTNEKGTLATWRSVPKWQLNGLYLATVQATEEAIINALVAAETMEGISGNTVYGLSAARLQAVLRKYNRLVEPAK